MGLVAMSCGRDPGRAGLCYGAGSLGPGCQVCLYGSYLFTFLGWEAPGQACNYNIRGEGRPCGGLMASGHPMWWEAGAGCSNSGETEAASPHHRACPGQLEPHL